MKTKTDFKLSEELNRKIIAYIEKNQPEYYWDYREELSKEQIERIIKEVDGLSDIEDEIYENNCDYDFELEEDCMDSAMNEFKSEISEEIGEEQYVWEDDFKDYYRDYISIDTDIKGLIRNTRKQVFFYDTCEEFDETWCMSKTEIYNNIRRIKKTIGLKTNEYDKDIRLMLMQASYGGRLVVYFMSDVYELYEALQHINARTKIKFNGYVTIAIIDTCNGSGDNIEVNHTFELPFNKDNLFYEDVIKYNYSWAVCGMSHDWCSGTNWDIYEAKKIVKAVKESSLNNSINNDRKLTKIYQSGKCTAGDMDMNRHRHVTYINNFPCGNKCLDCGTFWID